MLTDTTRGYNSLRFAQYSQFEPISKDFFQKTDQMVKFWENGLHFQNQREFPTKCNVFLFFRHCQKKSRPTRLET